VACHYADPTGASIPPPLITLRRRPLRIALVGNPNVGKSVLFGRLTGRYATVSNYPGPTVAVTRGRTVLGAEVCDVIDTPGVNVLEGALSEDERITHRLVSSPEADLVVQVGDARNLRRVLMLTSQARPSGQADGAGAEHGG
jgi:ferrous iron transport protein B